MKCFRKTLQWVPSHCGISGNEKADNLAKQGSRDNQTNNPVSIQETTTIIKSIFRNRGNTRDNYHNLSRKEQVIIFRLRTGHNRLNKHMHKMMKRAPSPQCPCGEAEQDTQHILQDCRLLRKEREETWPTATSLPDKLYQGS